MALLTLARAQAEVCDSHKAHSARLALSTHPLQCPRCTHAGGNGEAVFPCSSCQPLLNSENAFSFRPVIASPPIKLCPKMAQILRRSPSLSPTLPLQHKVRTHPSPPPCLSQAGADRHRHTSADPGTPRRAAPNPSSGQGQELHSTTKQSPGEPRCAGL